MKALNWTGLTLAAVLLWGCGSEGGRGGDRITLTGSSTIAPLVEAAAEHYEADRPGVRIDVQRGGSSRGITDAAKGLNDIGMTSRALKPEEESGLNQHVVALDGIAFVVHASNPVSGLTRQQAKDIFTGAVTRWSEVGGGDAPIVVVNRPEGRSELDLVSDYFGLSPADMKADVVGGENQQAVKLVAGNADAIVYLSLGTASFESGAGTPLRLLDLEGVPATPDAVARGDYVLGRPLVLVIGASVSPAAQAFLDHLMSPGLDTLIAEQGFVVPPR